MGLSIMYLLCFIGGFAPISSRVYYYFIFVFIGVVKALLFPCLISILAEWFPRKHRGLIFGIFMTSINVGYIISLEVSTLVEKISWYWIIFFNSMLAAVMAVIIFLFLVPNP